MFISLLQGQEQCSASEQSLDCRNDLDEEKALSAYLDYISKIQGVDRQAVVKVREILWDFIDYRKGPQDELTRLNRKELRASKSYQSILDEYYHAETLSKRKEQLLQNYTNRNQEFFQRAREHYKKLAEYKILGNYQEAAAKIQQAMGPIEAPEKDRMTVENGVVVFRVTEKISGQAERHRLRQQFTASDFTPTGFYLPPNTELKVSVKLEKGQRLPKLLVDTYGRHGFYCSLLNRNNCNSGGENQTNNAREMALKEGENIVSDPHGGLLYIRYVDDHPSDSEARISFLEGMKPAPFFRMAKTTHEEWLKMLQEDKYKESPDVILEGKRVMIVVSREKAIQYKDEDQGEVLRAADNIVRFQDEFSGLDGSSKKHMPNMHKYLMTQMPPRPNDPRVLSEAYFHYTAYNEETSIPNIMTGKGLIINGHTVWHEISHMHQQSEWTWEAINEPNANLYAWITKKKMGHNSEYDPDYYRRISEYFRLPIQQRDFNQNGDPGYAPNDIRLLFFKQLYKAYGEDFYKNLHRHTRENPEDLTTDKEKTNYFILAACRVSGHNLHNVFQYWGLITTKNARISHEINKLNLPEPDEKTKKILMPDFQNTDDKSKLVDDKLKLSFLVQIEDELIKTKINTDFIYKEEAKIKFVIKELLTDMDGLYMNAGHCEFAEIIKGKNGKQNFEYPLKEKCIGYERVDRGKGLTDRKIKLEVLMDDERDPLYKTDFTILNFD